MAEPEAQIEAWLAREWLAEEGVAEEGVAHHPQPAREPAQNRAQDRAQDRVGALPRDSLASMQAAGLLAPVADYAALARIKALLVERTGLLGIATLWGGPQLVFRHFLRGFGSQAQQDAWASRVLAVAISEPRVGAHPKHLTTRAEAVAEGFRLTGEKAWVSNGPSAEAIIVLAITEQTGDEATAVRKRYSAFLLPRHTPGLTMSDMPGFHALRPSRHGLLRLDGCVVPASTMLGSAGSAYERMALTFRDVEDAVGTYAILGALRHAIGQFAGAVPAATSAAASRAPMTEGLGAVVALTAVYAAGAATVLTALDAGGLRTGDATLVGLRVLALDVVARLRGLAAEAGGAVAARLAGGLDDLDASLAVARGPRLARQAQLGASALASLSASTGALAGVKQ